jgi:hypothetical protein
MDPPGDGWKEIDEGPDAGTFIMPELKMFFFYRMT